MTTQTTSIAETYKAALEKGGEKHLPGDAKEPAAKWISGMSDAECDDLYHASGLSKRYPKMTLHNAAPMLAKRLVDAAYASGEFQSHDPSTGEASPQSGGGYTPTTQTGATDRWNQAVTDARESGLAGAKAVAHANKVNPGLREKMLRESNQPKPKPRDRKPMNATDKWQERVSEAKASGMSNAQAVSHVNKKYPGLRDQMLQEVNSQPRARR